MKNVKILIFFILLLTAMVSYSQDQTNLGRLIPPTPEDSSWIPMSANPNDIIVCAAADGSDLYVGGYFTSIGGIAANHIAKYNTSTGVWSALIDGSGNNGVSGGLGVWHILIDGNKIYLGGNFTNVGGGGGSTNYKFVCYFDKSNNTWNDMNSGVDGEVFTLAKRGNDIYVGGSFNWAGPVVLLSAHDKTDPKKPLSISHFNNIAKWTPGAGWSGLGSGTSGGSDKVCSIFPDGDLIYVAGAFNNVMDDAAHAVPNTKCMAVYNTNTSQWSTAYTGAFTGNYINNIIKYNGSFYVVGDFVIIGGVDAFCAAKLTGTTWSSMGGGFNNVGYQILLNGSDIYATGNFTRVNETTTPTTANHIAKWNGSIWSSLGSGLDDKVEKGMVFVNNYLYVVGNFTTAGSKASKYLAYWKTVSPPAVSSPNSSITSINRVNLGATVTHDGGFPVTDRGIVISRSANPTISDIKYSTSGTTGIFSITVGGVMPNVLYHYRGYATNQLGTGYTNDATFTINFLPPVLFSPANNLTEINTETDLTWFPAALAYTYKIQISTNPDMSDAFCLYETSATKFFTDYLIDETSYYWRVQSCQSPYYSDWSPIWKFTSKRAGHIIVNPRGPYLLSLMNFGSTSATSTGKKDTIIFLNTGPSNITITGKILYNETLLNMINQKRQKNTVSSLDPEDEKILTVKYGNRFLVNDSSFIFIKNNYPVTLLPGEKDTTIIQFQPLTYGNHSAILTITSTDINAPVQTLHLIGTAAGTPEIEVGAGSLNYDTLYSLKSSKTGKVIIRNKGYLNLFVMRKFIEGKDRYNFNFSSGSQPVILPPGRNDTMSVSFTSFETVGKKSATLYIQSDAESNPISAVDLTGFIKAPIINPTGRILYDDVMIGAQKDSAASISNDGNAPLIINKSYIDGINSSEFSYSGLIDGKILQPNESVILSVSFKPSDPGVRYCRIALLSNDCIKPEASIVLRGNGITRNGSPSDLVGITQNRNFDYTLEQNFPNPFNPSTNIKFSLSKSGYTTLKVYDVIGKEAAVLINRNMEPGEYSISFNASKLPSGIYYYRLISGNYNIMKKMLLVK
jgi:hypothetical protein